MQKLLSPDAADLFAVLRMPMTAGMLIHDQTFNQLYDQAIHISDITEKTLMYEKLNAIVAELTPALLLPLLPHVCFST